MPAVFRTQSAFEIKIGRLSRRTLIGLVVGGIMGCGAGATPITHTHVGPHQAALLGLPDNAGFVEVVNEPEVTDRRGNPSTAIVVYFLQSDEKSPLASPPTDVRVTLALSRKKTEVVALKTEPKADDATGGCRFVSKVGPYLLDDNHATLSGKLDGKPFELDLSGGR